MAESLRENALARPEIRLRLWPAVLVVILHAAIACGAYLFGSTAIHGFIGIGAAPILASLLLMIWWLAASRAPWRDRVAGVVLFLMANAAIGLSSQYPFGFMLLAFATPAMTTGAVLLLVITRGIRWPVRRWIIVALFAGCVVLFSLMRANGVSGNMVPVVSWRWTPTAEERSAGLLRQEVHGTAVLPAEAGPGDWPGFRGPKRDGCVTGVTFSVDPAVPPRELWRRPVGVAWSSFAAVGDYIFTQEQRGPGEYVTCYRADTGEPVWVNETPAFHEDPMGSGPRATPTFDRGRLYTFGATGVAQCLDAATGATVWRRDVCADTGAGVPQWGFSASPLVVGERVIVLTGGAEGKSVIAYDRNSGEIAWCAGRKSSGYASAHFAVIGEVPQVLATGSFGIESLVPETGAPLWEHAWPTKSNPRCVQPLLSGDGLIMIGTTSPTGSRLIEVRREQDRWTASERWTTKWYRPYFNDSVERDGYCYGFDGERLACVDLSTGKLKWTGERCGGQVMLVADMNLLLVLTETGEVLFADAAPDAYVERGRFQALSGKTWNHPVIAHGRVIVRNAEEAACFELK